MFCLDGVLVLDLCRRYPGAYTAMFLGDFGADVIKIDPPRGFVPGRGRGISEGRFAAFNALDRNKRSIFLDLKNDRGREVLYQLARGADVLIEGFRPGVMDRLGAGYPQLAELNPRLIYCSLSGFGQDGPYARQPAHDMNFVALSGALSLIGERNGRPYLPSNLIADSAGAGLHGVIGILLALIARSRTGRGQHVDVAYLDSVVSLLAATASEYYQTGKVPRRGEHPFTGAAPWAQVFRCRDGQYVAVGAMEQHLWENFCRAIGRVDLFPDREPARDRADQVIAELAAIFQQRTREEWGEFFRDKETCVSPVNGIDEALENPQVLHREMAVKVEHPTLGTIRQTGIPIKLSDTPGRIRGLGVSTGSDTEAVLAELGYENEEIAALRQSGALG